MTLEKILKNTKYRKNLAKAIALHCFRNTELENLHSGIVPSTKVGDYSDVKVTTPYSTIEWPQLSRLDDNEMKTLMIDVVNHTYNFLTTLSNNKHILTLLTKTDICPEWNDPSVSLPICNRMVGNYDSTLNKHIDP